MFRRQADSGGESCPPCWDTIGRQPIAESISNRFRIGLKSILCSHRYWHDLYSPFWLSDHENRDGKVSKLLKRAVWRGYTAEKLLFCCGGMGSGRVANESEGASKSGPDHVGQNRFRIDSDPIHQNHRIANQINLESILCCAVRLCQKCGQVRVQFLWGTHFVRSGGSGGCGQMSCSLGLGAGHACWSRVKGAIV